jgi:hypothetical protein
VASASAARKYQASWILRYRFAGKSKEKALGRYPDISAGCPRTHPKRSGEDSARRGRRRGEKQHFKLVNRRKRPCLALRRVWYTRYIVPNKTGTDRILFHPLRRSHHRTPDGRPGGAGTHERILDRAVKAGAPTVANDLLRYMVRMFNFAIRKR